MRSTRRASVCVFLLSNGFIAMLLTERYVAGRSQNSLVTGLAAPGHRRLRLLAGHAAGMGRTRRS